MMAIMVWWRSFRHLEHRGYIYVWANLCFLLLLLPIVTAPTGFAGLVKMSRTAHLSRQSNLNIFWQGVRENFWRGTFLGIVTVSILIINISNLYAYTATTPIEVVLRYTWFGAIIFWLMIMLYFWPLYYEMRSPSILGALQNAALMILLNPGFTLLIWVGVLLWVGLSVIVPPLGMLLTFSMLSILSTRAVFNRLIASGHDAPERMHVAVHDGDIL